ncbi:MAG: pentapeptide repeat-containing protein [Elusimicrobia bacterium]|nr:pentapeptide repeat-containing protein [Elusimicrobiota bacterium]
MKKLIIFAVAVTLNGVVFASGFESLKSNSNLTSLNAKTMIDAEFVIPAATQKVDISVDETKTKDSSYYYQPDGVCRNAAGEEGYNQVTVGELYFLNGEVDSLNGEYECADLRNAYLMGVIMIGINLKGANMLGANLSWAVMGASDLSGAIMSLADLSNSIMLMANLSGADLSGANLNRIDLKEADLSGTDLGGANLIEADLREANLNEACLNAAILSMSNLSGAKLKDSKYNDMTFLPFSEEEANKRGMIKVAD